MNLNHSYYLLLLCNLDFSILELTLSTFLGFGSALLVEAIITYYNNKKYKAQLIDDLIIELGNIKNIINGLEDGKGLYATLFYSYLERSMCNWSNFKFK